MIAVSDEPDAADGGRGAGGQPGARGRRARCPSRRRAAGGGAHGRRGRRAAARGAARAGARRAAGGGPRAGGRGRAAARAGRRGAAGRRRAWWWRARRAGPWSCATTRCAEPRRSVARDRPGSIPLVASGGAAAAPAARPSPGTPGCRTRGALPHRQFHVDHVLAHEPDRRPFRLARKGTGLLRGGGRAAACRRSIHEALTSFRLALRESPNDTDVLQQIAVTYTRIGMTDEAMKTYRRVLELKPHAAGAHYGLAFLLLQAGSTGRRRGAPARVPGPPARDAQRGAPRGARPADPGRHHRRGRGRAVGAAAGPVTEDGRTTRRTWCWRSPRRPTRSRRSASPARWWTSGSSPAPTWFPGLTSIYRWQGAVQADAEVLLRDEDAARAGAGA